MELTTAQQCALLVMLATSALACFIFYSIGLRTGKATGFEQGQEDTKNHRLQTVENLRAELWNANHKLDARTREAMTLRNNVKAEAEDHAKVERGLLNRLAAASPLSDEDHAVLIAVVAKLELAADTFAGLNAHDHARFSRHLQAQVLDMAERIKKAQANTLPHPDSELIDFLSTAASLKITAHDEWRIEYPSMRHPHRSASIRETIRCFREELEHLENAHEEAEEVAQDREDAA